MANSTTSVTCRFCGVELSLPVTAGDPVRTLRFHIERNHMLDCIELAEYTGQLIDRIIYIPQDGKDEWAQQAHATLDQLLALEWDKRVLGAASTLNLPLSGSVRQPLPTPAQSTQVAGQA